MLRVPWTPVKISDESIYYYAHAADRGYHNILFLNEGKAFDNIISIGPCSMGQILHLGLTPPYGK